MRRDTKLVLMTGSEVLREDAAKQVAEETERLAQRKPLNWADRPALVIAGYRWYTVQGYAQYTFMTEGKNIRHDGLKKGLTYIPHRSK